MNKEINNCNTIDFKFLHKYISGRKHEQWYAAISAQVQSMDFPPELVLALTHQGLDTWPVSVFRTGTRVLADH